MTFSNQKTFNLGAWNRLLAYLSGDQANAPLSRLAQTALVPIAAILVFLMLWAGGARNVETSLGQLPGPAKVWEQTLSLYDEHLQEREKETAFYERLQKRLDKAVAAGKPQETLDKIRILIQSNGD